MEENKVDLKEEEKQENITIVTQVINQEILIEDVISSKVNEPESNPISNHLSEKPKSFEELKENKSLLDLEKEKNEINLTDSSKKEIKSNESPKNQEIIEHKENNSNKEILIDEKSNKEILIESKSNKDILIESKSNKEIELEKEEIKSEKENLKNNDTNELNLEISNKPDLISNLPSVVQVLLKAHAENKKEIPTENIKQEKSVFSEYDLKIIEKKKTRFNQIKSWDLIRSKIINSMINLTDNLYIKIDQRIRLSEINYNNIVLFFKDIEKHESDYAKYKNQKLINKNNDPKNEFEYSEFKNLISSFDDSQEIKNKKILNFCNFIEKNILNENLKKEKDSFDKEISNLKKKILDLKKKLSTNNLETSEKVSEYFKIYKEMINEKFNYNDKNDLLIYEVNFLNSAEKQMKGVLNLLIETLQFILNFVKMEKIRIENFKKIFLDYLDQFSFVHGWESFKEIKLKFEEYDSKEIEEKNSINCFFNKNDLLIFEKQFLLIDEIVFYLKEEYKFPCLPLENPIVKYNKEILIKKKNESNFEKIFIKITFDNNFFLFKNSDIIPYLSWTLKNIKIKNLEHENCYEIKEKIIGIIFNREINYILKIEDMDDFKEFRKNVEEMEINK